MNDNKEDIFYKKLKEELFKSSLWPCNYMFKFIVPTDEKKIKNVETSFCGYPKAKIQKKTSQKGNYTSISVKVFVHSPDDVILQYKAVSHIEGIISI